MCFVLLPPVVNPTTVNKYITSIGVPHNLPHKLYKGIFYFDFTVPDKSVPLQAWSGPEGSRKLRFPDFMTTAQDGGKVVSLTHRQPLPPGNAPGTHFC